MSVNFYLDPFVLACPNHADGIEVFDNYIQNILSWRTLIQQNWAQIHITEQAVETLVSTNRYPLWGDLKEAISRLGVQGVQAKDIVVLVDGLLQKSPPIERKIGIKDVLAEGTVLNPGNHIEGRDQTFQDQYARILLLMALACISKNLGSHNQILLSRHADGKILVAIHSTITYIDGEWNGPAIPLLVQQEFSSCSDQYTIYRLVNPTEVWVSSNEPRIKKEAVHLSMYQRHGVDCWTNEADVPNWTFGHDFLETCRTLGFMNDVQKATNLLQAIVDCTCQRNLRNTHHIRTGDGGNSPQLTRAADGAGAWRRDIDHEYHIHYWQVEGRIELASVVTHNDLSIPS